MNEDVFEPYPILETDRLILRQILPEDLNEIFRFNSDLNSIKYIARDPFADISVAEERVNFFRKMNEEKKAIWWSFTLKDSGLFLGYGGIFEMDKTNNRAEIGYGLLPEHWGKGFVSEAMEAMVEFGVSKIKLHKIHAIVDPGNGASIKILEKNGFQREGLMRDHFFARDKYFDMCFYARINN